MRLALITFASVLSLAGTLAPLPAQMSDRGASERLHASPEWASISAHLPDPGTATPATLETAADTLRARRYPIDAVQFYRAALTRGGEPVILLKKMGIACLEMQQVEIARNYFQQAVRLNKRDAASWNNLGATDFILHDNWGAIHDYKKAVKLDRTSSVFHANLALAYFEGRQTESARRELAKGLALDPDLLHKAGQTGYTAQVLPTERYSEICFEMARIYAAQGKVDVMLEWLTKASDRGYDVRSALYREPALRPLLADARVQIILKNTQQMQARAKPPANIPTLGVEQ